MTFSPYKAVEPDSIEKPKKLSNSNFRRERQTFLKESITEMKE